ncbi:probetacellulin-like [Polypterus senegalus]
MAIFIMRTITLVVITGLALCRYACANRNSTSKAELEELLCHQMNRNCSEAIGLAKRGGHFSKCPKEYKDYCIKGKCRYVIQEQQPACICEEGYIGSRCELMDFFIQRGDKKQIIIASLIAAMVLLIFIIIFICICAHRQKFCHKKKRKPEESVEEENNLNALSKDNKDSVAINMEGTNIEMETTNIA